MDRTSDLKISPSLINCALPDSLSLRHTYSELFLCFFDADAGMVLVRANYSANSAHTHATRPAIDAIYLLVLLAPPLRHIIHSRHKRMALEHGWLQMNLQVLWAHGGTTHQAGLHSCPLLTTGAVVADYGAASWRPFTGFIRGAGRFQSLLILTYFLFPIAVGWARKFLRELRGLGAGWWWWVLFQFRCLYSTTGCFTKLSVSLTILWTWFTGWSHGCLGVKRRSLSFRWRCFCGCSLFCRCLITRRVIDGDCVVLRWTCA